jgi:hypothetical protein
MFSIVDAVLQAQIHLSELPGSLLGYQEFFQRKKAVSP